MRWNGKKLERRVRLVHMVRSESSLLLKLHKQRMSELLTKKEEQEAAIQWLVRAWTLRDKGGRQWRLCPAAEEKELGMGRKSVQPLREEAKGQIRLFGWRPAITALLLLSISPSLWKLGSWFFLYCLSPCVDSCSSSF